MENFKLRIFEKNNRENKMDVDYIFGQGEKMNLDSRNYKLISRKLLSLDDFSELIDNVRKLNIPGLDWIFEKGIYFDEFEESILGDMIMNYFQGKSFSEGDDKMLDYRKSLVDRLFELSRCFAFTSSRSGKELNSKGGLSRAVLNLELKFDKNYKGEKEEKPYQYGFHTMSILYVCGAYYHREKYAAYLAKPEDSGLCEFSSKILDLSLEQLTRLVKKYNDNPNGI